MAADRVDVTTRSVKRAALPQLSSAQEGRLLFCPQRSTTVDAVPSPESYFNSIACSIGTILLFMKISFVCLPLFLKYL